MAPLASILTATLASPEAMLFFLLAAGVTAMSAVAFLLWLAFHCVRFVALLLFRTGRSSQDPAGRHPAPRRLRACPDPVCRSVNPVHAKFCRQCGRVLRPVVEYRDETVSVIGSSNSSRAGG